MSVCLASRVSQITGYDMSAYIRKYAKYINEKAVSYRLMAFDFCKVKRGKEDGLLRTMQPDKVNRVGYTYILLLTLPSATPYFYINQVFSLGCMMALGHPI